MKKELRLFDKPENVKRLLFLFFVALAVLLFIDLFLDKHAEFEWEGVPGFFAAYGFISYVLLIFVSKLLRKLIKRDEDYYD